ncbi:MAG: hypothetical protein QW548_02510 [Candidatus Aenigmatarchaeota archaeon]
MAIDAEKARKDGWIEAWFAIDVIGASPEIVEASLKEHVGKLAKMENVLVSKTEFHKIEEVKNPPKPLQRGWGQVVNVTLFAKDLYTLVMAILLYGPSAIEILSPASKQVSAGELQNIANTLSGLLHQFAAAGVGGIVLTPSGPKCGGCGR